MFKKKRIKKYIAFLVYKAGLLKLIYKSRSHNRGFVLMYHRVVSREAAQKLGVQHSMYVTPSTFEKHVQILVKNFKVVSLSELILRAKAGKKNGGYCSVTFDDGWLDNYINAYPIIVKKRVPITIFLATGFIGTMRWFWPDIVSFSLGYILFHKHEDRLPGIVNDCISSSRDKSVSAISERVIVRLKSLPVDQRNELIGNILKVSGNPPTQRMVMDWKEIREMDQSGYVDFGAHTVNHEMLDKLNENIIFNEVVCSKEKIESILGKTCDLFCYPNGNVSDKIKKNIKRLHFHGAVTTRRGYITNALDFLEIPRIGMHEDISYNDSLFMWRIAGLDLL